METASLSKSLHYSGQDFTLAAIKDCSLFLKITSWELQAVAIDQANKVVAVFQFPLNNAEPWQDQVIQIFGQHAFLASPLWKEVMVVVSTTHFTLIPDQIFSADLLPEYQKLLFQPFSGEKLATRKHENGYINVYTIDGALEEWLNLTFSQKPVIVHQTSALIEAFLAKQVKDNSELTMLVQVEPKYIIVLVKRNNQLLFCNLYNISAETDIAYFVLLTMKELGMNPEKESLSIYGQADPDNNAFKTLARYIRHIAPGDLPTNLHFASDFGQVIPSYRHFDIYGLPLCSR